MAEIDQILAQLEDGSKVLSQQFEILQTLGKGAFSKVKLAKWLPKDILVAMKIHKDLEKVDTESLKREIEVLAQVQHKNIIKLFSCQPQSLIEKKVKGVWEPHRTVYCTVVLELASGFELEKYIEVQKRFGENVSKYLFKEFMSGLSFLHDNGIAHRDLKPANILFDETLTLKIADFGFVAHERNSRDGLFQTYLGTPQYMAPEIHIILDLKEEGAPDEEMKYEPLPVDIFSAGIILFLTHVGFYPFLTAEMKDPIFSLIVDQGWEKFWELFQMKTKETFSADFKDLVQGMLDPDPVTRLTARQILESKWLQSGVATEKQALNELERRKFIIEDNKAKEKKRREERALNRNNFANPYKDRSLTDEHFEHDEEIQELMKHLKQKKFRERLSDEQNCFYLYTGVHPAEFDKYMDRCLELNGEGSEQFDQKRTGHFEYEISISINIPMPVLEEQDLLGFLEKLEFRQRTAQEEIDYEQRQEKIDMVLRVYDKVTSYEKKYLVECSIKQQVSKQVGRKVKEVLADLLDFQV